jgi:ABC-2 type transport system ATP-binding protein
MNKAVVVKDICKTINSHQILKNINLEIQEGKLYGLVGRNASGKSMLFKAICGLMRIDSGEIWVFDELVGKGGRFAKNTGAIIEHPGFLPQYSSCINLKVLANIQNKINDDVIKSTLQRVGLDLNDKRHYRKYSLGMKQKLSIAQAIMESPKLLILDEPMNNLDEQSIELIRDLLQELKSNGTTILLSSHNRADIEILCDRVIHIKDGEILDSSNSEAKHE